VILGAAVIDDVLGLMILAVVSGIVAQGSVGFPEVARIIVVSLLFLTGALAIGSRFARVIAHYMSGLRVAGMKLITALIFGFGLAWTAGMVGLAPIVGAFAAGMILDESLFARFTREKPLKELLEPFTGVFVPVFFVVMGIDVHLEALADPGVLALAAAVTIAAILGKQVCGLVAVGRGLDRVSIGVGMIPRGEVGLIFAGVGRSLGVVDDALYGASIVMVLVTTFIAPPILQLRMKNRAARAA
jgi:Kef-type K+ transport system membrane component KefB